MRPTKVPKYPVAELERRAEHLLRDAWGWPPSIPVDIESLTRKRQRPARMVLSPAALAVR